MGYYNAVVHNECVTYKAVFLLLADNAGLCPSPRHQFGSLAMTYTVLCDEDEHHQPFYTRTPNGVQDTVHRLKGPETFICIERSESSSHVDEMR